MTSEQRQRLLELCEQVSKEKDPEKAIELAQEFDRFLESICLQIESTGGD